MLLYQCIQSALIVWRVMKISGGRVAASYASRTKYSDSAPASSSSATPCLRFPARCSSPIVERAEVERRHHDLLGYSGRAHRSDPNGGSVQYDPLPVGFGGKGGFFPAVVVYLTHWFRQEDRAKTVGGEVSPFS